MPFIFVQNVTVLPPLSLLFGKINGISWFYLSIVTINYDLDFLEFELICRLPNVASLDLWRFEKMLEHW